MPLFEGFEDYAVFESILREADAQTQVRIAAYCLLPTHWHLLLCPRGEGELSDGMDYGHAPFLSKRSPIAA